VSYSIFSVAELDIVSVSARSIVKMFARIETFS